MAREAVGCGRLMQSWRGAEASVSEAMWDSMDMSVHGRPLRASSLQEQNTCSYISLSLSAMLLFFLASTSTQGQTGWGPEQPDLGGDVPAHG